jgi:hypothetical protein
VKTQLLIKRYSIEIQALDELWVRLIVHNPHYLQLFVDFAFKYTAVDSFQ